MVAARYWDSFGAIVSKNRYRAILRGTQGSCANRKDLVQMSRRREQAGVRNPSCWLVAMGFDAEESTSIGSRTIRIPATSDSGVFTNSGVPSRALYARDIPKVTQRGLSVSANNRHDPSMSLCTWYNSKVPTTAGHDSALPPSSPRTAAQLPARMSCPCHSSSRYQMSGSKSSARLRPAGS